MGAYKQNCLAHNSTLINNIQKNNRSGNNRKSEEQNFEINDKLLQKA